MNTQWYHTADGKNRLGPFTLQQMRQFARDGRLQPAHMVRRGDMPTWSPATPVRRPVLDRK